MHRDAVLHVSAGVVQGIRPRNESGGSLTDLGDVTLAPGFIDWQVNGGGGVMFNDSPSAEGIATIARAHAACGTTTLLPTLITDAPEAMDAAAAAVAAARAAGMASIAGIHFEGPHLSLARQGAHEAGFIRPMEESDHERLARRDLGVVLTTLAPESASLADIRRLVDAGVLVSLGHSDCDYEMAWRAFSAGARAVTHIFNAMSGLGHRAPGLAGAALDHPGVTCGLIADGHHVHPAACRIAIRAKPAGQVTFVTDAMACVGGGTDGFTLNGRPVRRRGGRLELEDGTLAGSDLDMASALRYAATHLGLPVEEALRMAALYPARLLRLEDARGHLRPGARADMVALDGELRPRAVWIGGVAQPAAQSPDRPDRLA
ncbi:N-acetylglucosamine-6-phosphate deacetylase [Maritimibacter sp. 55A14]|uniref:N-acetylglucosamine-6-phosphate deacetylase n=1 Tax=Maritimibacter sp. 55A14 TaxID=2174844 RepID=UPI000D610BFB|nr:N-acetylglucosamine-6-phosphate deacetylase [Maritimibacter sp. 55A14]PWE33213.1 N-acetylglucosamine-6-phosphate deacetylase [Maritimibacter sp. 55A14]